MAVVEANGTTVNKTHSFSRYRMTVWPPVIFFSGLLITCLLFLYLYNSNQEILSDKFEHVTQSRFSAIHKELSELSDTVLTVQYFMSHYKTEQNLSHDPGYFVKQMLDNKSHARAVAWVLPNPAPGYDTGQYGDFHPGAENCHAPDNVSSSQAFRLCSLMPLEHGESLLANGLVKNPELVTALAQALQTGEMVVSGPAAAGQHLTSEQRQHRFFVYPVSHNRQSAMNVEAGAALPQGFLVIESHIPDLVEMGLKQYPEEDDEVDIFLVDSFADGSSQLLSFHASRLHENLAEQSLIPVPDVNSPLVTATVLHIGGRNWQLILAGAPDVFGKMPGTESIAVLLTGIILCSLMAALLVNIYDKKQFAEKQVAHRTRELAEINSSLEEEVMNRKHTETEINYDLQVKQTFNAVLETAMTSLSLNKKLEIILQLILDAEWLSIDTRGCIFLADEGRKRLTLTVQHGLAEPLLVSCANISFGQCLCGKAAASQEIVFSSCVDHQHEIIYPGMKQHGHYCIPILSDQKILGILNLYVEHNHQSNEPEQFNLRMIANILAGLIEHDRIEALAKKALNDLDNQVKALDEHAIVSITDVHGDITYVNDKFTEISQYSREELIGKNHRMLKSETNQDEIYRGLWQTIVQGKPWKGETCNRKKDGTHYWVAATIVPFLNKEGKPDKYVAIHVDITAKKENEQQLIAKNHEIEQANKELDESHHMMLHSEKLASVGQLAAGIAHEINTPIQFVGDNTRFLQGAFDDLMKLISVYKALGKAANDGKISAELANKASNLSEEVEVAYLAEEIPIAIGQSLEGVERISKIVRSMKDFSHPGTDDLEIINLNNAIENTITVSRNEWKYVAEMVTEFDPALTAVPCFPGELNQVILNMIVNAAHAIQAHHNETDQPGTIKISTKLDGNDAEICIADSGCGMSEEVRNHIFEPFFTTKGVGKGTGQGLAIAYAVIVEKHNGSVKVDSLPGNGTTFIMRLPMNKTTSNAEMDDSEVINNSSGAI